MPGRRTTTLSDAEILQIFDAIPLGSESKVEDSDSDDPDFVAGDDVVMHTSQLPDSDDEQSGSDNDDDDQNHSNKTVDAPKWKKSFSIRTSPDFSKSFGVPEALKQEIEDPTPVKIFDQFLSQDVIDLIVFQTNLYAQQSGKSYSPTNDDEIRSFLGMNVLIGVKKLPSYRDYWSSNPKLNDPFISKLMSQNRFDWILSYLHLNDNVMMPNRKSIDYDKLYKVRPFLDIILRNFKKCYLPGQEVVVDESTVKFKGRCSFKQYNPMKPIKRGYKIWVLADKSGYFLNGEIYWGKSDQGVTKDLGGSVVRKLTTDLQGGFHKIFFDNYFASYDLVKDLKQQDLDSCGTVRKNRKKFPSQFKSDQSLKRGEHDWFISEDGIQSLKWKDKRVVHIVSSYHDPKTVVEVERKEKSGQTIKINCPIAVRDYNFNINFVDKFDQMKKAYEVDRKSHKW